MPIKSDRSGQITLILGGTRSGKSSFAQKLAEESENQLVYVATAEAFDQEMAERIKRHQNDRGPDWQTIEESRDIAATITARSSPQVTILVDCLTIWISNLMLTGTDIEAASEKLIYALKEASGPIILVSNEVGSGIVPESPLGRKFRDESGRMNQRLAAISGNVALIVAGLPLWLKSVQAEGRT